jgi:hypothetical protein
MRHIKPLFAAALLAAGHSAFAAPHQDDWNFTVYLDDQKVGYHNFTLNEDGTNRKIHSKAHFNGKVLIVGSFSYDHEANEAWNGDCLTQMTTHTDDGGDIYDVSGQLQDGRFKVKQGKEEAALGSCVMTFAYWNPLMLKQKQLLDPQNGEYNTVRIDLKGKETIPVRGKPVAAKKYHLDAGKFKIDLWYAEDDQRWIGLDSEVKLGYVLHYRVE